MTNLQKFVLLLALGFTLGTHAIQSESSALIAYKEAVERLNKTPHLKSGKVEKAVAEVVRTAGALLTERGVTWKLDPQNAQCIVIQADDTPTIFNRFARGLHKNMGGLELRFDPAALKKENAGAEYDEEKNHLMMALEDIAAGQISDYLAHESRHGKDFFDIVRGRDNIFIGWLYGDPKTPEFDDTYPHKFSIDELTAYDIQIKINMSEIRRKADSADPEGTQTVIDVGRRLAQAAFDVIRSMLDPVSKLLRSEQNLKLIKAKRQIDEDMVETMGFKNDEVAIYFYSQALVERLPQLNPVTHGVIEVGSYKIDLILPMAYNEKNLVALAKMLDDRAKQLATISQKLIKKFDDANEELQKLTKDE